MLGEAVARDVEAEHAVGVEDEDGTVRATAPHRHVHDVDECGRLEVRRQGDDESLPRRDVRPEDSEQDITAPSWRSSCSSQRKQQPMRAIPQQHSYLSQNCMLLLLFSS